MKTKLLLLSIPIILALQSCREKPLMPGEVTGKWELSVTLNMAAAQRLVDLPPMALMGNSAELRSEREFKLDGTYFTHFELEVEIPSFTESMPFLFRSMESGEWLVDGKKVLLMPQKHKIFTLDAGFDEFVPDEPVHKAMLYPVDNPNLVVELNPRRVSGDKLELAEVNDVDLEIIYRKK